MRTITNKIGLFLLLVYPLNIFCLDSNLKTEEVMQKASSTIVLSNSLMGPEIAPAPLLKVMFTYAREHKTAELNQMRKEVEAQNDNNLAAAYALALYISTPNSYGQEFVTRLPVDSLGIKYLTNEVELKGLTPSFLYFIDALGAIAERGNPAAIKKIILGVGNSDAGATELFCEHLETILNTQLVKTIHSFSELDKQSRRKAYECFKLIDSAEMSKLKEKLQKLRVSKSESIIVKEMQQY